MSYLLQLMQFSVSVFLSFVEPCAGSVAYCALDLIFDFGSVYIFFACLYFMLPTSFFLHFFLTYLVPYLSFPLRIDPLRFQAGCRKRQLNLALVFFAFVCCSMFLLIGECLVLLC